MTPTVTTGVVTLAVIYVIWIKDGAPVGRNIGGLFNGRSKPAELTGTIGENHCTRREWRIQKESERTEGVFDRMGGVFDVVRAFSRRTLSIEVYRRREWTRTMEAVGRQ